MFSISSFLKTQTDFTVSSRSQVKLPTPAIEKMRVFWYETTFCALQNENREVYMVKQCFNRQRFRKLNNKIRGISPRMIYSTIKENVYSVLRQLMTKSW